MPRRCQSCGHPSDAPLHRVHFDADADGRFCRPIDVCADCRAWYKERLKRVAASNRARKRRRGAGLSYEVPGEAPIVVVREEP